MVANSTLYIFDDHYRKANPGKADFLLLPGWELPAGDRRGKAPKLPASEDGELTGDGEGTIALTRVAGRPHVLLLRPVS